MPLHPSGVAPPLQDTLTGINAPLAEVSKLTRSPGTFHEAPASFLIIARSQLKQEEWLCSPDSEKPHFSLQWSLDSLARRWPLPAGVWWLRMAMCAWDAPPR